MSAQNMRTYYITRRLISVGLETALQFSSYIPEAKGVYCEN